jgi:hypothetical protein
MESGQRSLARDGLNAALSASEGEPRIQKLDGLKRLE